MLKAKGKTRGFAKVFLDAEKVNKEEKTMVLPILWRNEKAFRSAAKHIYP